MRDTPSLRSATGFGEVFRDLDSLMFVSALQAELQVPKVMVLGAQPRNSRQVARRLGPLGQLLVSECARESFGRRPRTEAQRSAIERALRAARQIQVERVSYQSPLEIVLAWTNEIAQQPWGFKGFMLSAAAGSTGALYVVNRAINLWEKLSDARVKHADAEKAPVSVRNAVASARADGADADVKEYEAQIKAAEVRMKELAVKLKESEVELKVKAHHVVHGQLDLVQAIHAGGSATTPELNTGALLQQLNQAADSLVSIQDMKVLDE